MEPQLEEVIEETKRLDEEEIGEGEEGKEEISEYDMKLRDVSELLGKP